MNCDSEVLYLKGAQSQLDVESGCYSSVLRQEGKYSVVHPKQRNQEQGGFCQPPEWSKKKGMKKETLKISPDNDVTLWKITVCYQYGQLLSVMSEVQVSNARQTKCVIQVSSKLQWWCQIFITLTFKTTSSSGQSVEKIKMSKHKTWTHCA